MDPASPALPTHRLLHRNASPDPPSTRRNPFNDGQNIARKRRRTSISGPPVASLGTTDLAQGRILKSTAFSNHRFEHVSPMMVGTASNTSQVADSGHARRPSPSRPLSGKAFARHRILSNSAPPSPSSLSFTLLSDIELQPISSGPREPGATDVHDSKSGTIKSSSTSHSPSTEINDPPGHADSESDSDDDDAEGDADNETGFPAATNTGESGNHAVPVSDPTNKFPYKEPDEKLCETVHRLAQYLSNHSPLDGNILSQVLEWLDGYLHYAKVTNAEQVLDSRRKQSSFWIVFPDIIIAMISRKPELIRMPALRSNVLAFYTKFVTLTARFVILDYLALLSVPSPSSAIDRDPPDLYSPAYLHQLHSIVLPNASTPTDPSEDAPLIAGGPQQDLESYLIGKLLISPGGSVDCLSRLVFALTALVPTYTKLADGLAALSIALSDCMRESLRVVRIGRGGVGRAKRQLELGHRIWDTLSESLAMIIDKHVTQLSGDCVSTQIQALSEALKVLLQNNHKQALDRVREHRLTYPNLPHKYTSEAISWQWKVDVLERLIRSSQMQLRVMAVTTMCTHLVSVWKRLCDTGDILSAEFLNHLAAYLLRTGLIDYILGANCHPEIIIESANIIGFLVVTRTYNSEHTNRLWNGIVSSQDPRVADALSRMMSSITNLFDYAGLLGICSKFQALPIDQFSPSMRMLLDNVLSELMVRCQTNQTTLTYHPFGLCLRLLRESSICTSSAQVVDPEMQQMAMQKFKELLSQGPDPEGRRELYLSCIDDISAKSDTTLGSLWCLSMAIRQASLGQLRILTEQHDLTRLIVEELEHASGIAGGTSSVLSGTANQPRRDLLSSIIQFQPATLTGTLGSRLWNLLVGANSFCPNDTKAGWQTILGATRKSTSRNSFLQTAFADYLPSLPPALFCEGMLDFVKERGLALLNGSNCKFVLDDDAAAQVVIEQLWRLILGADNSHLVEQAVVTLAVDVYLESGAITSYPLHRSTVIHLGLVNRCLRQMKDAATKISLLGSGPADGAPNGTKSIDTTSDDESKKQRIIFSRSLQTLRLFLEKYQSKPNFAVADLRSFMAQGPQTVEGDPAELKYQAFEGEGQSDIQTLQIGRCNTVASLLASLREVTGFENYRVYYRGRQLLPAQQDICKSLQELNIQDGFILIKKEENFSASPVQIKPGSSPIEIEILAHFSELWGYLNMDERIAEEIYDFVVKLPSDSRIMSLFDSDADYRDLLPADQPFKSLYVIHALKDHIEAVSRGSPTGKCVVDYESDGLTRAMRLVTQALSDPSVLGAAMDSLRFRVASSMMQIFVRLIQDVYDTKPSTLVIGVDVPRSERLIDLLDSAIRCPDETGLPLIDSTLRAILRICFLDHLFLSSVTKNIAFRTIVQKLVLVDPRKAVRQTALELVETFVLAQAQHDAVDATDSTGTNIIGCDGLSLYFWSIVTELFPEVLKFPNHCDEYFKILKLLLALLSKKDLKEIQVEPLAGQAVDLLLSHVSSESIDQVEPKDAVAHGLVSLLQLCLQVDSSLITAKIMPEDTPRKLLWKHLFPARPSQTADGSVPQIVLNSKTRFKLFEIILRLIQEDRYQLGQVLIILNELVPYYADDNDDPYLYELPYQFDRSRAMRSHCGYAGLRNLSNTCYLNSLLVQLYMNTEFRRFILGAANQDPLNSQQLLFHTQKVFGFMQESYRRYVDPTSLVSSIKTYEDTVIDIHNQMDVDEFYNLLFDRWEGQLRSPDERRKLRSFYGGQLVQQVKSKECEHISERLEPFSAIQCDIKGKSTLQESLQAYVDGEIMEGDNKYKCSTCDRHVDAVKRACLKDVPDNLIFHLKRFDFNLRTLQRSKINDYFSFPLNIDLRPYTIEHLSDLNMKTSDVFDLVGILVHSGTAESGHYYSYIKERPSPMGNENWVEFNDDVVIRWDPALIPSSTFGGSDHRSGFEAHGTAYDKTYSAYMLFYQRASSLRTEKESMMSHNLLAPLRVGLPSLLREHIASENTVILRRHCLFDPGHAAFVQNCFNLTRNLENDELCSEVLNGIDGSIGSPSRQALQRLAMEMILSHLDQVISRTKDTPSFGLLSTAIKGAINEGRTYSGAFYLYFSKRHAAFRALLQRCPEQHVRAFAGEALILALERIGAKSLSREGDNINLYDFNPSRVVESASECETKGDDDEYEGDEDDDDWETEKEISEDSVAEGVLLMFNYLWQHFQVHIRSWDEYFGTILAFAKLGQRQVSHLLSEDYLGKLMRIVTADVALDLPANYARMLSNVLRRVNTRPPSYAAVLAVIDYLMAQLEPTLGPEVIVDRPSERLVHEVPFPWTSDEVHAVHYHPDRQVASFFLEKLVAIDQDWETIKAIVGRLILTGPPMDVRVFNTLRKNIDGELSTQAMDPFLRIAARYVECTRSVDRGQALMRHISAQAPSLQNTEGAAFLSFFKTALRSRLPSEELVQSRREACVKLIPTWAPHLLVYPEARTRNETVKLLEDELFRFSSLEDGSEEEGEGRKRESLDGVVRDLGIKCLVYLREMHVRRRVKIERDAAWSILRVVGRCSPCCEGRQEMKGNEDDEFSAIQSEIMDPLRRLMVDEVEDTVSDWEGSCASSDLVEANMGISKAAIGERREREMMM